MGSIKVQDFYKVLVTESGGIAASGDVNFTLSSAPRYTNGFLVIEPDSTTNRETVYFHNVIGNRVYVRGVNRKNPKFHAVSATVQMNDVEEIFNFYSDMASPLFYVEKTGGLTIRVWGGTVLINRTQVTIADTSLTLTDNATNYVVYDYLTNIVSVNTTGVGLVKATIVVASGTITSITYNVIKESYADPFVPDTSLVAPYVQNQSWTYATSTGAVNTYAITLSPAPTAYVAGQKFTFKANLANTGTATLNVNGLGAKTIKKLGGTANIANGDVLLGQIVEVAYNGVDFDMVSPTSAGVLDINGLANKPSSLDTNDTLPIYDSVGLVNKKHNAKASTTNEGLVEMATDAESVGYTDQTRYVNPKQAWDVANKKIFLPYPSMILPTSGGATQGLYGFSMSASALNEIDFVFNVSGYYTSISSLVFHFIGSTTNTGNLYLFAGIRRYRSGTWSVFNTSTEYEHSFAGTASALTNLTATNGLLAGLTFQDGDIIFFSLTRNGSHVNDTYTGTSDLIGATITFA